MQWKRVGAFVGATVLATVLTACGGDDDGAQPPATSAPPTSSGTPTSTAPSSTPAPTTQPTRFVEKHGALTLVFNQPANVPAAARAPLRTYLEFERVTSISLATNRKHSRLPALAAPPVIRFFDGFLRDQIRAGERTIGQMTITARVLGATKGITVIQACYDQSRATVVKADGSRRDPETKKLRTRADLSRSVQAWRVTAYRLEAVRSC